MNQGNNAHPAGARERPCLAKALATYSPWEFQIVINARDTEVFDPTGGLSAETRHYPVVWHEYVHYLQNIGTTIGSRIFLNVIAVLVGLGQVAHDKNPIIVPMYRDSSNPFPSILSGFHAEVRTLLGLMAPL